MCRLQWLQRDGDEATSGWDRRRDRRCRLQWLQRDGDEATSGRDRRSNDRWLCFVGSSVAHRCVLVLVLVETMQYRRHVVNAQPTTVPCPYHQTVQPPLHHIAMVENLALVRLASYKFLLGVMPPDSVLPLAGGSPRSPSRSRISLRLESSLSSSAWMRW
eukprot:COSAG02_NODE_901_length_16056_cov_52.549477_2_plen_160_part_00